MQPQRGRRVIAVPHKKNYTASPLLVNCSFATTRTYAATTLWANYGCTMERNFCGHNAFCQQWLCSRGGVMQLHRLEPLMAVLSESNYAATSLLACYDSASKGNHAATPFVTSCCCAAKIELFNHTTCNSHLQPRCRMANLPSSR